jgi:hypothetical protein
MNQYEADERSIVPPDTKDLAADPMVESFATQSLSEEARDSGGPATPSELMGPTVDPSTVRHDVEKVWRRLHGEPGRTTRARRRFESRTPSYHADFDDALGDGVVNVLGGGSAVRRARHQDPVTTERVFLRTIDRNRQRAVREGKRRRSLDATVESGLGMMDMGPLDGPSERFECAAIREKIRENKSLFDFWRYTLADPDGRRRIAEELKISPMRLRARMSELAARLRANPWWQARRDDLLKLLILLGLVRSGSARAASRAPSAARLAGGTLVIVGLSLVPVSWGGGEAGPSSSAHAEPITALTATDHDGPAQFEMEAAGPARPSRSVTTLVARRSPRAPVRLRATAGFLPLAEVAPEQPPIALPTALLPAAEEIAMKPEVAPEPPAPQAPERDRTGLGELGMFRAARAAADGGRWEVADLMLDELRKQHRLGEMWRESDALRVEVAYALQRWTEVRDVGVSLLARAPQIEADPLTMGAVAEAAVWLEDSALACELRARHVALPKPLRLPIRTTCQGGR